MGLLDSVLGAVQGAASGQLGGQPGGQGALISGLISMLAQGNQGGGGGLNLPALLQQLQQGGLGEAVSSWVSTGPNQAVTPNQLQDALGSSQLGQIASMLGLDKGTAASQLSELLPQAVDALTPQGQMPAAGADLSSLATQVLGKFLAR